MNKTPNFFQVIIRLCSKDIIIFIISNIILFNSSLSGGNIGWGPIAFLYFIVLQNTIHIILYYILKYINNYHYIYINIIVNIFIIFISLINREKDYNSGGIYLLKIYIMSYLIAEVIIFFIIVKRKKGK